MIHYIEPYVCPWYGPATHDVDGSSDSLERAPVDSQGSAALGGPGGRLRVLSTCPTFG